MDQLKELFYPTRKKLIVFVVIFLTSSFMLYGNLAGNITTYDESWPKWINGLMVIWSFISLTGLVFQGPVVFMQQFMPNSPDLLRGILLAAAVLINSYIQGSLIGIIWETKKTKQENNYLKIYAAGVTATFLGLIIRSVSESSNDSLLLAGGGLTLFLVVYFTKRFIVKIFKPIFLLTIFIVFGLFGSAISDFEESYCWNYKVGPALEYSDHMDCHKKFDLIKAIREKGIL